MKSLALVSGLLLAACLACAQAAVPQAEQLDVATLRPSYPHRLFVLEPYLGTGVEILDGDTLKVEGTLPTNDSGDLALGPQGRHFYVCETIWSLGNRGVRQDMVTVYDSRTLGVSAEIPLAGRLIIAARTHACDISANGRFGFVYNMQPASSIIVVDLAMHSVASVIETPGCALALPWGDTGFSSLCGNGSLEDISLTSRGRLKRISHTRPFFDADHDPVFSESLVDRDTGRALLLTYTGLIYPVTLGRKPAIGMPWSLQASAGMPVAGRGVQELAWRPGGLQMMAWNKALGRLYVLMHVGTYWTQTRPGTEVWVLDIATHALLERLKLPDPTVSIAVSQDRQPLLYAITKEGKVLTLDPTTGQQKAALKMPGAIHLWVPGF